MKKKSKRQITSLITALVFLFTQFAVPLPGFAAEKQSSSEVKLSPEFQLNLPPDLGTIQNLISGQGPTLIHIQDAHGNYEAQQKIEAILNYLKNEYGIKVLLLEGAASKLDPNRLRFFPKDMAVTRKILDGLTSNGLVESAETFLVENADIEGYGIENLNLYLANGEALRAVLAAGEKTEGFIRDMDMQIENLTGPYLNKDLRAFLKRLEDFEAKRLPLMDWLTFLKMQAKEVSQIDLGDPAYQIDWPMLERIYKLSEFESKIDMKAFPAERDQFLKEIEPSFVGAGSPRPSISKGEETSPLQTYRQIQSLLSAPVSRHQLPDPETGLLFEKMAAGLPADFNYDAYPNVRRFIGHLILQSEVKGERLMGEMNRLTDQISEKLAKTSEEKKILILLKDHRLLKRLFALELTPEDYEQALSRGDDLRPSAATQRFLELNGTKRVRNIEFKHLEEIDLLYEKALEFYRGVKDRDRYMTENILARMKELGADKAVVITGGFHAEPFKNFFERKNYNYALIAPRITTVDGRENYVAASLLWGVKSSTRMIENLEDPRIVPPDAVVARIASGIVKVLGTDGVGLKEGNIYYQLNRWENVAVINDLLDRTQIRVSVKPGKSVVKTERAIWQPVGINQIVVSPAKETAPVRSEARNLVLVRGEATGNSATYKWEGEPANLLTVLSVIGEQMGVGNYQSDLTFRIEGVSPRFNEPDTSSVTIKPDTVIEVSRITSPAVSRSFSPYDLPEGDVSNWATLQQLMSRVAAASSAKDQEDQLSEVIVFGDAVKGVLTAKSVVDAILDHVPKTGLTGASKFSYSWSPTPQGVVLKITPPRAETRAVMTLEEEIRLKRGEIVKGGNGVTLPLERGTGIPQTVTPRRSVVPVTPVTVLINFNANEIPGPGEIVPGQIRLVPARISGGEGIIPGISEQVPTAPPQTVSAPAGVPSFPVSATSPSVIVVLGPEPEQPAQPLVLGFINPGTLTLYPLVPRFGLPVTPELVNPLLEKKNQVRETRPLPFSTIPINFEGRPTQVRLPLIPVASTIALPSFEAVGLPGRIQRTLRESNVTTPPALINLVNQGPQAIPRLSEPQFETVVRLLTQGIPEAIRIEALGLPGNIVRALQNSNIRTVQGLTETSPLELPDIFRRAGIQEASIPVLIAQIEGRLEKVGGVVPTRAAIPATFKEVGISETLANKLTQVEVLNPSQLITILNQGPITTREKIPSLQPREIQTVANLIVPRFPQAVTIEALGLPGNIVTALQRSNIQTVAGLVGIPPAELRNKLQQAIPGISAPQVNEIINPIRERLEFFGVKTELEIPEEILNAINVPTTQALVNLVNQGPQAIVPRITTPQFETLVRILAQRIPEAIRIEALGLPGNIVTALQNSNIRTAAELAAQLPNQLVNLGIPETGIREIQETLDRFGVRPNVRGEPPAELLRALREAGFPTKQPVPAVEPEPTRRITPEEVAKAEREVEKAVAEIAKAEPQKPQTAEVKPPVPVSVTVPTVTPLVGRLPTPRRSQAGPVEVSQIITPPVQIVLEKFREFLISRFLLETLGTEIAREVLEYALSRPVYAAAAVGGQPAFLPTPSLFQEMVGATGPVTVEPTEEYLQGVRDRFSRLSPDTLPSVVIDSFWRRELRGSDLLNLLVIGSTAQSAAKGKSPVIVFLGEKIGDKGKILSELKFKLTSRDNGIGDPEKRSSAIKFAVNLALYVDVIEPREGEAPVQALNRYIEANGAGSLNRDILEGLRGVVDFVAKQNLAKDAAVMPFVIEKILYAASAMRGLKKLDPNKPTELLQAELIREIGIVVSIVRQGNQSFMVIQSLAQFVESLRSQLRIQVAA